MCRLFNINRVINRNTRKNPTTSQIPLMPATITAPAHQSLLAASLRLPNPSAQSPQVSNPTKTMKTKKFFKSRRGGEQLQAADSPLPRHLWSSSTAMSLSTFLPRPFPFNPLSFFLLSAQENCTSRLLPFQNSAYTEAPLSHVSTEFILLYCHL